mgnify:CR=1 FL=1
MTSSTLNQLPYHPLLAKAKEMLKQGNIEGLRDIVGITKDLHPQSKIYITEDTIFYQVPDGGGLFASISIEEINKAQKVNFNDVVLQKILHLQVK